LSFRYSFGGPAPKAEEEAAEEEPKAAP